MKKVLFLSVILLLAIAMACKKKEVPPPPPPPPKPEVVKISEMEFINGLISMVPQLELGKAVDVTVDKSLVISEEKVFTVSLFPVEFTYPEGKEYVVKYMFPSVVWRLSDSQLGVFNLPDYLSNSKPGEKIWILKESPKGTPPFKNIPTLLVKSDGGNFWILNQTGDEMPLRANWGK